MRKLTLVLLVISLLALPLWGCGGGLTLMIGEPEDGAIVTESPVYLEGNVSDPDATVTVNGVEVEVGGCPKFEVSVRVEVPGFFWADVELTEGENIITVVATKGKETVTKTVTVTYTPSE